MQAVPAFLGHHSRTVELSRQDIRQINTDSLRANESCMTQETHLFVGTLAENILIAKPDATPEELAAACEKAALGQTRQEVAHGRLL
ncbi:ABC transporter ATP-binding protein, partial [Adlercreutzia equolifaciens]|nr:ABC transporter ATP-binding protein [Adlercreutzia equolifaciens]